MEELASLLVAADAVVVTPQKPTVLRIDEQLGRLVRLARDAIVLRVALEHELIVGIDLPGLFEGRLGDRQERPLSSRVRLLDGNPRRQTPQHHGVLQTRRGNLNRLPNAQRFERIGLVDQGGICQQRLRVCRVQLDGAFQGELCLVPLFSRGAVSQSLVANEQRVRQCPGDQGIEGIQPGCLPRILNAGEFVAESRLNVASKHVAIGEDRAQLEACVQMVQCLRVLSPGICQSAGKKTAFAVIEVVRRCRRDRPLGQRPVVLAASHVEKLADRSMPPARRSASQMSSSGRRRLRLGGIEHRLPLRNGLVELTAGLIKQTQLGRPDDRIAQAANRLQSNLAAPRLRTVRGIGLRQKTPAEQCLYILPGLFQERLHDCSGHGRIVLRNQHRAQRLQAPAVHSGRIDEQQALGQIRLPSAAFVQIGLHGPHRIFRCADLTL